MASKALEEAIAGSPAAQKFMQKAAAAAIPEAAVLIMVRELVKQQLVADQKAAAAECARRVAEFGSLLTLETPEVVALGKQETVDPADSRSSTDAYLSGIFKGAVVSVAQLLARAVVRTMGHAPDEEQAAVAVAMLGVTDADRQQAVAQIREGRLSPADAESVANQAAVVATERGGEPNPEGDAMLVIELQAARVRARDRAEISEPRSRAHHEAAVRHLGSDAAASAVGRTTGHPQVSNELATRSAYLDGLEEALRAMNEQQRPLILKAFSHP